MRLSIEVTKDQHQQLKASAALQGQSIKNYVLERTLPNTDEQAALRKLEAFLKPRVEAVHNNQLSEKTVEDIFTDVERENS
ncbi:MAG: antitoxin [Gammaproteobacteria bacterium]|nr:MAG: antitoxin [Gammaproteobacteria bacterium]PCH63437.1 MAG: antitoxin [Gammaproteobacteria bacterium]